MKVASKQLALFLLLLLALAPAITLAAPIMIGDFEDGTTQGWFQNGSRPNSVVTDPSGNSSYALAVDWLADGFDWSLGIDDAANPDILQLANGGLPQQQKVEFDIYWNPADWGGDGWAQWSIVTYNYDGGWTQDDTPTSGDKTWFTDASSSTALVSEHLVWDFVANGTPLASTTSFAQIFLATNAGSLDPLNSITGGTFYIDNISITVDDMNPVPEPVTLSLIGAGLLGFSLMRRRRSIV